MINCKSILTLLVITGLSAASLSAQRRRARPVPARPVPARQQKPQPRQQQAQTAITRTDTTIRSTTLEVYQQYEPELKPITKPELAPTLPPPPATRAAQQYDVPQQTLYYSYRALPLRPLALGKDTISPQLSNYALLGGGNLSTILGEVGIGSLRGPNAQYAFSGRYITQEGNLKDQVYRNLSLKGNGSWKTPGHLLSAGVDFHRSVFGRYGYDHDVLKYDFDDVRAAYSRVGVTLGAQNSQRGPLGIDYRPSVTASYFTGSTLASERNIALHLPFSRKIDSNLSAELGVHAVFTTLDTGTGTRNNNVLQLTPGATFHKDNFYAHFGLYPTFGRSGTSYLLPDIVTRLKIGQSGAVSATAGWQAKLVQNTAEQLTTANPFTKLDSLEIRQTRTDDVFAGLNIAFGKHLTVWGRGGWQQYSSLPLFVTRAGGDGKEFDIIYDRQVQAITWNAGVRYAIGEDFSLGAEGMWYNFYKHTYSRVWGEPGIRLKGSAAWRPVGSLLITAYAEVLDRIWGQDAQLKEVKLRGVFDLGAAAEYTVIEKLNLFLRAENILGRNNERWQGYPSFGFNIYGGARFRF